MRINNPLKRKNLTLIELLIAISLLAIILTEGLLLLTSQTKTAANSKKIINKFLKREEVFLVIEGLFFHLNVQDKACLKIDKQIFLSFDNQIQLEPSLSGFQKACLDFENGCLKLIFEKNEHSVLIASNVKEFSLKCYSQKTHWKPHWNSQSEGLPEMVHLVLKTKDFEIDQKFLCPYKQIPVSLLCRLFPLSFL